MNGALTEFGMNDLEFSPQTPPKEEASPFNWESFEEKIIALSSNTTAFPINERFRLASTNAAPEPSRRSERELSQPVNTADWQYFTGAGFAVFEAKVHSDTKALFTYIRYPSSKHALMVLSPTRSVASPTPQSRTRDSFLEQVDSTRRATKQLQSIVGAVSPAEIEDLEELERPIERLVLRFGRAGLRAISRFIFGAAAGSELSTFLLAALAKMDDPDSEADRRNLTVTALESRNAALRYSAAIALGEMNDAAAAIALKRRLTRERNKDVANMIKAQLR